MGNGLIPLDVKRRQTPARLIRSVATLALASRSHKGVKKLSPEESALIADIIYTGVVRYNNANGHKLNDNDLIRIQKKLAKLDVYTYEEERGTSEEEREKRSEELGRPINKTNQTGFLLRGTGGLVLDKKRYDNFREHKDSESYIKTITHEGFHYLTNGSKREYGMERVIAEGSDESFIIKTFADGKNSTIMGDQKGNGAVHYNFCSRTRYSLSVSLLNMLGIMVNINPEVSELKQNNKFTDVVKQRYGEDFYKKLVKRAECWLSPKKFEKMRNETRYIRRLQQFVLRTIVNDIIENVKDPEDAVKRLNALQRTEAWSARILLKKRDPKTNNITAYEPCRDFEFWYRKAYVKTIEKLQQKGYQNLEAVKACKYRMTKFAKLRKLEIENNEKGKAKFYSKAYNTRIFFKYYYGIDKFEAVVSKETVDLYEKIRDEYAEENKRKKEQEKAQAAQAQAQAPQRPQRPQGPVNPNKPNRPNRPNKDDGPDIGD